MVKADPKHDYYADLELPPNADSETIKKQFRLLAKQYHPDRNPGREVEVVPKFQAVQAANEILSDPTQKKRYDADRGKLNRSQDDLSTHGPMFKKQPKPAPPPPTTNFPPPPKRSPAPPQGQFQPNNVRPTPSASAEKFAQFTRAAPHQWDRDKFNDMAKAEALRNLNNMRNQSTQPPRVPPRAPTAPKPSGTTSASDAPPPSGPPPGFPGLSRTNSARRTGFAPGAPGGSEPPASSSAYAHVHRSDRSQPPVVNYPYPSNLPKTGMSTSPPTQRNQKSMSPLRTNSTGYDSAQRPNLSRTSSRYATNSGEKTDINGPGLARSASVRNSPIENRWDESGPFGARSHSRSQSGFKPPPPPPRHHSSSPRGRFGKGKFSLSASESSSEDEPAQPTADRPKATPRKARPPHPSASRTFPEDGLTGQASKKNYTNITSDNQYHYPPPETNDTTYRRHFPDPQSPIDDITHQLNNAGIRHVHKDDVPPTNSSTQRANGISSEHQSATQNPNPTFSAADWDGKFANADNIFRPTESTATSRSKSPSKQPRPKLPNRNRSAPRSQEGRDEESSASDEISPKMAGVRHVAGTTDTQNKGAAFQAGKFSAEDWAERLRSQSEANAPKATPRSKSAKSSAAQPRVHDEVEVEEDSSSPEQNKPQHNSNASPDAMEVDDSLHPNQATASGAGGSRVPSRVASRRPSSGGIGLDELGQTAPFKPAATGLSNLDDLNGSLPFESRAAEDLNLHQPPSSGPAARHLHLPPPPKPIMAPDEMHLSQENWSKYSERMQQYMHDWNVFNCKMIDHFRIRQEQISLSMYHNWITAVGDGASADDFDGLDFVGHEHAGEDRANGNTSTQAKHKKAGYATYMQWLEQDRVCRSWWEVAFEEHAACMEDLGRVRQVVKSIRAKEFGKHH